MEQTPFTEPDPAQLAVKAAGSRSHRRMTLTPLALTRAEEAMWLVTGATKHDALDRLLPATSPLPPPACRLGGR